MCTPPVTKFGHFVASFLQIVSNWYTNPIKTITRNHSELDELKQQTAGPLLPPKAKVAIRLINIYARKELFQAPARFIKTLNARKLLYSYLTANAAYNIPQRKTIFFLLILITEPRRHKRHCYKTPCVSFRVHRRYAKKEQGGKKG